MSNLHSPNEIMAAGKEIMLDGREPTDYCDAVKLMNFIATNVASGLEIQICQVMARIYPDVFNWLAEDEINYIARRTAQAKNERN